MKVEFSTASHVLDAAAALSAEAIVLKPEGHQEQEAAERRSQRFATFSL